MDSNAQTERVLYYKLEGVKQEAQKRCDIFRRRWVTNDSKMKWLKFSKCK